MFDPTTGAIDCTNCKRDLAPTIGLLPVRVKITPPTLVVRSLKPTPGGPTAGRPFTLKLVAARSDTGAVVQNGRVTCVGRVGTARLTAPVQRVQGGAATCTWNIPANAKGKTFRGSVDGGLRRAEGVTELRGEGSLAPPPVRRLALLASLFVSRRQHRDGRRLRSIERRESVVEHALLKVRPAPDLAECSADSRQPRAGHHDARRSAARGRDVSRAGSAGSVPGRS